ncbi:uncharacterized protein [Parasteatoda tepidariorum]|uniref:uncharacterized protein n=1 Tax=Parasteatoda tepidariorum TaxID=114398 RepID=UPI001C718477|nr:uncharacterized protein LOC107451948 [Parasteatoda tepidariorum]
MEIFMLQLVFSWSIHSRCKAMDFLIVTVLLGLLANGKAQKPVTSDELNIEVPEITEDFFEEILQYFPGSSGMYEHFASTPEPKFAKSTHEPEGIEITLEPEVVRSTTVPSYNEFCKDISHGLHDIDGKYPKLKALKSKLYTYFFSSMAEYERNPHKRKNIALDILSELIKLLQMLQKKIGDCPVRHVPVVSVPPVEEIIAEEVVYPPFVGSVRGIPGVNYPNYTEVPITSFSCSDKKYIPGFYADLETGCQVFHVCYEHRRESFLCPIGTLFNQPILACDYWYSSNCSLSEHYYDVNEEKDEVHISEPEKDHVEELITTIIEQEKTTIPRIVVKSKDSVKIDADLDQILKFLPVKAKVVEFPEKPAPKLLPVLEPKFVKAAVAIPAMKVAAKVAPILKAKIEDAVKMKVEKAIKTKVAAKVVPVAKMKAVGAVKAKLATAAAAAPVVKAKVLAAAVPVVKTKIAAAVPLVKSKVISAAAGPLLKAKVTAKALPVVKMAAIDAKLLAAAKAKKAAMISPLTKKALALGYLKLLKAKKFAMMG